MAEAHADLAAALREIASNNSNGDHGAVEDDDEAGFVDARSDDGEEHVHTDSSATAASDPFGGAAYVSSAASGDFSASGEPSASGASARASSAASAFDYDDKWSEEYHGPKLDRSARATMEADEVPDSDKDASMASAFKDEGNRHYGKGDHDRAVACYTEAMKYVPRDVDFDSHRAVYYANRAACFLAMEKYADALYDCDRALEFNPTYVKALSRRAAALEHLKKYEDATKDYETLMTLDPSQSTARAAIDRLKRLMHERDEKLKADMMGKLKDMGNWVLNKFGLSMDNFKAVQDPATGSYSISFQQ